MKRKSVAVTIRPFDIVYAALLILCALLAVVSVFGLIEIFGSFSESFKQPNAFLIVQLIIAAFGGVLLIGIAVYLSFLLLRAKVVFKNEAFEITPTIKTYRLPPKKQKKLKTRITKKQILKYCELKSFGIYTNREIEQMAKSGRIHVMKTVSALGGVPVLVQMSSKMFKNGEAIVYVTGKGRIVIDDSHYSPSQLQNLFYQLKQRSGIEPSGYALPKKVQKLKHFSALTTLCRALYFFYFPIIVLAVAAAFKQHSLGELAVFSVLITHYSADVFIAFQNVLIKQNRKNAFGFDRLLIYGALALYMAELVIVYLILR